MRGSYSRSAVCVAAQTIVSSRRTLLIAILPTNRVEPVANFDQGRSRFSGWPAAVRSRNAMFIIDIATAGLLLSDRRENSALAFIGWIALGAITGFIGSKLINKTGHGRHRDVLLGVVGAIVGGFL